MKFCSDWIDSLSLYRHYLCFIKSYEIDMLDNLAAITQNPDSGVYTLYLIDNILTNSSLKYLKELGLSNLKNKGFTVVPERLRAMV